MFCPLPVRFGQIFAYFGKKICQNCRDTSAHGDFFPTRFCQALRTFARKFSNIDFFLQILLLKDDELVMSEM